MSGQRKHHSCKAVAHILTHSNKKHLEIWWQRQIHELQLMLMRETLSNCSQNICCSNVNISPATRSNLFTTWCGFDLIEYYIIHGNVMLSAFHCVASSRPWESHVKVITLDLLFCLLNFNWFHFSNYIHIFFFGSGKTSLLSSYFSFYLSYLFCNLIILLFVFKFWGRGKQKPNDCE